MSADVYLLGLIRCFVGHATESLRKVKLELRVLSKGNLIRRQERAFKFKVCRSGRIFAYYVAEQVAKSRYALRLKIHLRPIRLEPIKVLVQQQLIIIILSTSIRVQHYSLLHLVSKLSAASAF